MQKFTARDIALTAVMSAAVFAASYLQIEIPLGIDNTRLHLGNVCCLLAGITLGCVKGGLAAGIGSAFFDLTNPLYITSAPFTFAFKFLMGFVCGLIARRGNARGKSVKWNVTGGIAGSVTYIILYLSRHWITNIFFLQVEFGTALTTLLQKAAVSSTNAVIAVICAVPLGIALNKALEVSHIRN